MILPKILLFTEDDSLSNSMSTCLLHAGYKVVSASRGSKALELIRAEHPSLVILDIDLPDYNSLAILRSLRLQETDYHLPAILMGASMKDEDVLIGLEVGADLCLKETFHPQVFVARVRSLLRRSELLKTA